MSEEPNTGEEVGRGEFDEPFGDSTDRDPDELAIEDLVRELEGLETEIHDLRGEVSRFEQAVEDRTVERPSLEADLRKYVRQRMRRNRARGWGPYLVLLYGTVMTLGAFYELAGGWAILAMIVVWLSTLGLYFVMVGVGVLFNVIGFPFRLRDAIANWRS